MTARKEAKQDEEAQRSFIETWKKQFQNDRTFKSTIDTEMNLYEEYYQGKRRFDNLRAAGENANRDVRTVLNFVRMVVEALIDLSVPTPDLAAIALDDEDAVKLLGTYVEHVCTAADLEEINLENERRVKKFGGAFFKVHWNTAIQYGEYVGDIEISNPHPLHIVPNAGCTSEKDMEHYHHIINQTAKYVLRRWPHVTKEELEDKAILYAEYDSLDNSTSDSNPNTKESGLNRYSIIETTYRDDDGDICKFWWSGELLIDHTKKFYWHRDDNGEPTKFETLKPGTPIRIGTDPETKEPIFRTVEPQLDEYDMPILDEEGIPIGEKVEYYIPKRWDIVYQPYLPKDLSFWGTSMIEDIRDIYEAILKAVYIQEESFLRGRKKITTDNEEDAKKLMDPGSEVITVRGTIGQIDLGTNIDGIGWMEWLLSKLQLITGATNAAMGVHDPGVKSGKQAQLYVSQANFKANLASTYKAIAYKKLYSIVADFAMAFCDDDRPFRLAGEKNKPEYASFSRLSMLRDNSGHVIYPNWDIAVSSQSGFMQNKSEIMNNIVMLANNKNFDPTPGNLLYLKILQKLGMPYLENILQEMEIEVKKQEEIQAEQREMQMKQQEQGLLNQQQGQGNAPSQAQAPLDPEALIASLPPEAQEAFGQLMKTNPEEAQRLLQDAVGG